MSELSITVKELIKLKDKIYSSQHCKIVDQSLSSYFESSVPSLLPTKWVQSSPYSTFLQLDQVALLVVLSDIVLS